MECFETQYCRVEYRENDGVVFLQWKKACCLENYRQPTMFAARLLHSHEGTDYIIDARNGFEDDKSDVEWGFKTLLPFMSKSQCRVCVFIMPQGSEIDGEMYMWSKEFSKYFTVKKVFSYEEAVEYTRGYRNRK